MTLDGVSAKTRPGGSNRLDGVDRSNANGVGASGAFRTSPLGLRAWTYSILSPVYVSGAPSGSPVTVAKALTDPSRVAAYDRLDWDHDSP